MALSFAHGAVQWLAADAVSTTYTISGLSFQPKALRFYTIGKSSTVDVGTGSGADDLRRSVGFATGTAARRCVGAFSDDAAAADDCSVSMRNDAVVVALAVTAGLEGLLDLGSITSDGFTLVVDDQLAADITVFWEAWGGSDITVATVGDFQEPAATGNVDYTVTGFVAAATDQVVMFASCTSVASANAQDGNTIDGGLSVGFASGGNDADNIVLVGSSDDGSATIDADGYCKTGECVAQIVAAGGNPDARAKLTQFGTDNFRLNWLARALTGRQNIFLAIKGGQWKAGSYTIAGNTLNATTTVSALAFAPVGISFMGRRSVESTVATSQAGLSWSLGSASSTSSRRTMGANVRDATSNVEVNQTIQYDQTLAFVSDTDGVGLLADYDVSAFNSDGFTVIVDLAGGVASEWQGYLTFGSSAGTPIATPAGALTLSGAAVTLARTNAQPAGTLALTGQTPVIARTVPPGAGALVLAGTTPTLARVIPPGAGAVTFTGAAPQCLRAVVAAFAAGSMALSGQYVDVAFAGPTAGAITLTGQAPTVDVASVAGTTPTPGAGTLSFSGGVPILTYVAPVPVGGVAITGQAPSVIQAVLRNPLSGSMALTGQTPAWSTTYGMPAGSVALAGQSPTAWQAITRALPVGALALTGQAPTSVEALLRSVPAGTLSLTGQVPSLAFSGAVPAGSLTLSGQSPALAGQFLVPAGAVAFSGTTPVLAWAAPMASGSIALTGHAPALALVLALPAGSINLTGQAAAIVGTGAVVVPAGALTLQGLAPIDAFAMALPAGSLTLTGQVPVRSLGDLRALSAGTLTVTGQTGILGVMLPLPSGALIITGQAPTQAGQTNLTMPAGGLVVAGAAPAGLLGQSLVVATGALVITGQSVTLDSGLTLPLGLVTLTGHSPALVGLLGQLPRVRRTSVDGGVQYILVDHGVRYTLVDGGVQYTLGGRSIRYDIATGLVYLVEDS